jgi:hypothetical protein
MALCDLLDFERTRPLQGMQPSNGLLYLYTSLADRGVSIMLLRSALSFSLYRAGPDP